jgi:phosphoserine phosphatase RsbU/P
VAAAPKPPPRQPAARLRRFEAFLRDYTAGVDERELRKLVDRDAPRVYSVLMRDHGGEAPPAKGPKRLFWNARLLFLSLSEKLSPPRRVIFALSLLAALFGILDVDFGFNTPEYGLQVDASPGFFLLAVAGLVFLLATELVDRVLVRDELEVARQLQNELLPKAPPLVPGWQFAHSWRTANDIGGDYCRFEPLPDGRWAIVMADASGHGMAAGLLMAITDTSLRIAIELDPSPHAVASLLHRAIRRTGDRRAFVTLFYALLDPASGRLEFVSAGHPSPVVRRRDGRLEEPAAGSLPIGARERNEPAAGEVTLAAGDVVVLATDGLFEALGPEQQTFGWERLRQLIAEPAVSATGLHERLREAVDRHAGDAAPSDDRTIVVFQRLADSDDE